MPICYKDMTFCSSDCVNNNCRRHWTPEKRKDAQKWWGTPHAPVAFSDFSKTCPDYKVPFETSIKTLDKS